MAVDLFKDPTLDQLIAQIVADMPKIKLSQLNVEPYEVRPGYVIERFHFPATSGEYGSAIRAAVEPIAERAEALGCNANLFTALYEAILNGHQHGNKLDPEKEVVVAYKIDSHSAEIAIIDQGGEVNPAFIPFIFKHRREDTQKSFINWYDYSKLQKPGTNNGTGTSFMHTYVDNVQYFKSEEGGLVVHLTKEW